MESKQLEILKSAIILERRGHEFYSKLAEQAKDSDVKSFFDMMAKEEEAHIRYLSHQFQLIAKDKLMEAPMESLSEDDQMAQKILTDKLIQKLSAVSFEATAIAAAIDFENRAIQLYSQRSLTAETEEERSFYRWLADWERGHHKILHEIDEQLKEKVWFDHSFWPF